MNRRVRNNLTVTFFFFALLLFLLGVMAGCGKKNSGNGAKAEAIPVRVKEVVLERLSIKYDFVGNIKAQYEAEVYPKVSGKIMEKGKNEGDSVEKDEPLMYIDRDEVGLKFEKAPVQSPIKGVVGLMYVDVGQRVQPAAPVAYVVDMEQVKIDLDIPEKYISDIKIEQETEVRVDTYPDKVFKGKITKMAPVLDAQSRTTAAEILINNRESFLKPGMFARVSIVKQVAEDTPVIIKEAIVGREPDAYVYVVEGTNAKKKKVTLGLKENDLLQITAGLKSGESVVVVGQQRLYDNAPVVVEKIE